MHVLCLHLIFQSKFRWVFSFTLSLIPHTHAQTHTHHNLSPHTHMHTPSLITHTCTYPLSSHTHAHTLSHHAHTLSHHTHINTHLLVILYYKIISEVLNQINMPTPGTSSHLSPSHSPSDILISFARISTSRLG